MNSIIENCSFGARVAVGEGSMLKYVKIGKDSKVWHYCNIYGVSNSMVKIGENSSIGSFSEIKPDVNIGNNCRFQSYVFIPEGVKIEDFVFLGPGVRFHNDKHPTAVKTLENTWKLERTVVKEFASIGGGALIGPGVAIGHHAIVGLGSVVIKDVPDYAVVLGNPARVVGDIRDAKYSKSYAEFFNR